MGEVSCDVCFRHCRLKEGMTGVCRARKNTGGSVTPENYGLITALALDPIEKKPIRGFYPGSMILSAGSFGCNMRCPFCQNHDIAEACEDSTYIRMQITPKELCKLAKSMEKRGNIGVAYTYNEALTGYEFVRDTAKAVHEEGMKNVLVTNGMFELHVLDEVLPYIDAMNIDIKAFTKEGYAELGGDFDAVKRFTEHASKKSHVEVTTLIVPGISDKEEDMRREAEWIASIDPGMILHITRYFPMHKSRAKATERAVLERLKKVAEEYLETVYLGNI